jgi:DNA-binding response OmpR family regulator
MTETEITILLVEDDEAIANGLSLNLKLEGFRPIIVHDGEAGLIAIEEHRPALILLDISLPKKNGLEVLSELRESGDTTPVIVLSARQNEFDKVSALRLGADDYVTKPFGVAELLARVDAVLRRLSSPAKASDDRSLYFADVEVNLATAQVYRNGELVAITHLEFELLTFLIENPDRVFTREQLLKQVWGVQHSGSPRTVDNFVGQLRAKFEEVPNKPDHFLTVRSKGYRFIP